MKSPARFLSFYFLAVLSVAGCSLYHVSSQEVSDEFYPPKTSPAEVQSLEQVNRPHKVIGYVTVNTERRNTLAQVIDKLKREAAILGGDAITNIQTDATGFWKKLPPQRLLGNAYIRVNFRATVVVFDTPSMPAISHADDFSIEPLPSLPQDYRREENLK